MSENERFEKWWHSEEPPYVDLRNVNRGSKEYAWAAWQASRALPDDVARARAKVVEAAKAWLKSECSMYEVAVLGKSIRALLAAEARENGGVT